MGKGVIQEANIKWLKRDRDCIGGDITWNLVIWISVLSQKFSHLRFYAFGDDREYVSQLAHSIILKRKLHTVTLVGDILGERTKMSQRTWRDSPILNLLRSRFRGTIGIWVHISAFKIKNYN